jgi:hypothetical protein
MRMKRGHGGSVAWCWQTILLMQTRWRKKTLDEQGFAAPVVTQSDLTFAAS